MKHSVYAYLREIDKRNETINNLRQYIEKRQAEFELSIKPTNDSIEKNFAHIQQIREMEIYANIGDIATCLAKYWDVPTEQVEISSFCDLDYTSKDPTSDIMAELEARDETYSIIHTVFSTKGKDYKLSHSVSISPQLRKDMIQADGKPLINHLRVVSTHNASCDTYDHSLQYDDPNQIIVPFHFSEIIDSYSPSSINFLSKAILDASDMLTDYSYDINN